MADSIDLAQAREQEDRERSLKRALQRSVTVSRFTCEECGAQIPEARRLAVQGVAFCVTCQEVNELKNKHYKGV